MLHRRQFLKQCVIAAVLPGALPLLRFVPLAQVACVPAMGMMVPTMIPMFVGDDCAPVPTDIPTASPTQTSTPMPTATATATATASPTRTPRPSPTQSPTATPRPVHRRYLPQVTK